ncbi:MAG: DUF5615 family PIN-like protein [Candidatus Wallbacteria bacterium]|nr:DUF5615 family PIN-like protein [Candidatus Wallbacteria bacterium]
MIMKFKIDENLPVEIADLLIEAGHDAETVPSEQLQGISDSNLLKICSGENRALLTLDTDFGNTAKT